MFKVLKLKHKVSHKPELTAVLKPSKNYWAFLSICCGRYNCSCLNTSSSSSYDFKLKLVSSLINTERVYCCITNWRRHAYSVARSLHCIDVANAFPCPSSLLWPSNQLIGTGLYAALPLHLSAQTLSSFYLSAPLPSSRYSVLNLGSPQTTQNHYVWLQRENRSRWLRLEFWGSSSSRLHGAMRVGAAWDCWYWAESSAPGRIHQKRRCLHCGNRHE